MTDDKTIVARLQYIVDEISAKKAEKSADGISKKLRDIGINSKFDELARDAAKFAAETGDAEEAAKQLDRALRKVGANEKEINDVAKAFDRETKAIEKAAQAAKDLAAEQEKLSANDRFDATSKRVALAGDVESNLRAFSGTAGAIGAGGAAQAIGLGAEIPALIEAAPRLKEAVKGLPDAFSAVRESIGLGGVGLIGGLALLGVALAATSEIAKKAKADFDAQLNAQAEYFTLIQTGTTESIQLASEEARLKADAARDNLETLRQQESALKNRDALGEQLLSNAFNNLQNLGIQVGEGGAAFASMEEAIEAAEQQLREAESSIGTYDKALASSAVAANDAAAAEQRLADTRADAALQQADFLGKQLAAEQRALAASTDSNNARLESIANEETILKRQLEVLRNSGSTNEQVTAQIEALTSQLGLLGEEANFIKDQALSNSRAREQAEATEQRINDKKKNQGKDTQKIEQDKSKATDDALKAQERSLQEQQALADKQAAIFDNLADARENAANDYASSLEDSDREAGRERLDALSEYNREEQKAARDQERELAKIKRDAQKAARDAIRERDFLSLFDVREDTQSQINESSSDFSAERDEQKIAFDERLDDLRIALERERQDLDINQGRKLESIQETFDKEQAAFQQQQLNKTAQQQMADDLELQLKQGKNAEALQLETQFSDARLSLLRSSLAQATSAMGSKSLQVGGYGSQTPLPTRPVTQSSTTNNNGGNSLNVNVNGSSDPKAVGKEVVKHINDYFGRLTQ